MRLTFGVARLGLVARLALERHHMDLAKRVLRPQPSLEPPAVPSKQRQDQGLVARQRLYAADRDVGYHDKGEGYEADGSPRI